MPYTRLILFAWALASILACPREAAAQAPSSQSPPLAGTPDFNRDVRPVLARHCFKCHGPDDNKREAGLRFDVREVAIGETESGATPIVPGQPEESELVRRISSDDEDELMPPPDQKNPLSDAEKQALIQWIAAGAQYDPHWSLVPPVQAPLPAVKATDWVRNPIDRFVLARLEAEGLQPSPPADRYTLVRRVYFDLIGLPPTPEEADAFANDDAPNAYQRLVDRLLASPHYGERWARAWLDLARYSDTNGYEKDRQRSMWPYRDWVIAALNADMPFDQFTIEQLAGDMLPNATLQQRIATGFHRNTMLNEEGGIDPLEFRFHAMTDRVATTATVWLGLTVGCAQCHTHKFDPIPHRDYYRFMALLNNADEPLLDVPQPQLTARRAELQQRIDALEADLANRFPVEDQWRWETPAASAVAQSGATLERLDDGSLRVSGATPQSDTYILTLDSKAADVAAIRLEALVDPALPNKGPGRTPHGNFVLTEISATAAPLDAPDNVATLKFVGAEADFAQDGFPPITAIDGNPKTGWAIQGPGEWKVNRTATFALERPTGFAGGTRWTVKLEQAYGGQHVLGRFRVSLGQRAPSEPPIAARRRQRLEERFNAWLADEAAGSVKWTVLRPATAKANVPALSILDDDSVLASGDQSKRDVYDVTFGGDFVGVTAVRLEVLPDDRLPAGGPGRVYYEGQPGGFFLSELTLAADGRPVHFSRATNSFANGEHVVSRAIDGDPQTGWSIDGGQGRAHSAVFSLDKPLSAARQLSLNIVCERYFAAGLGRFRISGTRDPRSLEARAHPAEIERLLTIAAADPTPPTLPASDSASLTAADREKLLRYFLSIAPELAAARAEIDALRNQLPAYPTTLVMSERPPENTRPTFIHHRGEFLQPTEPVEPEVPSALPPLPSDAPHDRLALARWLVDRRNPLVGRVVMNRHWAALFGRGLVRTPQDFGYQGDPPTHPELLDWLAVELFNQGMSIKRVQRLIVTSATYRQSSRVAPDLLARDPQNRLLARGPRVRLEAEMVRDLALSASGLLSAKLGGPSVFPPQPKGVTSEGTYQALNWTVSPGEDRYRRGLYTFNKRTAPYAMFTTFDAPSGEVCMARREVSNTPLQALALLNDAVFVEAAQSLGRQSAVEPGSPETRAAALFRRCLARPPADDELAMLVQFYRNQREQLETGQLDAAALAGGADGDARERAAWTALARVLLNLDETITKN